MHGLTSEGQVLHKTHGIFLTDFSQKNQCLCFFMRPAICYGPSDQSFSSQQSEAEQLHQRTTVQNAEYLRGAPDLMSWSVLLN